MSNLKVSIPAKLPQGFNAMSTSAQRTFCEQAGSKALASMGLPEDTLTKAIPSNAKSKVNQFVDLIKANKKPAAIFAGAATLVGLITTVLKHIHTNNK